MSRNAFRSMTIYSVFFIVLIISCNESTNDSSSNLPFFIDVLNQAGIFDVGGLGQTSAWGDYNNDGLLDLFIANTDFFLPPKCPFKNTSIKPSKL